MVPAGKVRAVHDFGAGDLLEITLTSGGSVMVPFTEADVPVVDLAAGRLVIASLDDWLGGDDTAETPE